MVSVVPRPFDFESEILESTISNVDFEDSLIHIGDSKILRLEIREEPTARTDTLGRVP